MKERIKTIATLIVCGMLIGLGVRIAEYVIPAPERKLEMHHTIDGESACIGFKETK